VNIVPADIGLLRSPREVLFGRGVRVALPRIIAAHGASVFICTDPVIVKTPGFTETLRDLQATGLRCTVWAVTEPELPLDAVNQAITAARTADPEVLLGFGGGSAIDLAKLVALGLSSDLPLSAHYGENLVPAGLVPIVAVPTTAGTGSEVTPVAVLADPDRAIKVGISSPELIPATALVDPDLTISCPATVTAFSGIDALTHAIESYSAQPRTLDLAGPLPVFIGSNRISAALGLEAAAAIAPALGVAVEDPANVTARTSMSYGSLLAGLAFGVGGTHLSHALQYPIGQLTHTPHGLGVGLLLPYVMEACLPTARQAITELGQAMGVGGNDPDVAAEATIRWVVDLRRQIGIPHTLTDIGVRPEDLPRIQELAGGVARLVANTPAHDPRALLEPVLRNALDGGSDIFSTSRLNSTGMTP
jgi:alcohol dehydrogenase class IV